MFTQQKISEHKTILGVYAVVTKGRSQNQRWRVEINGKHYGPYRTRRQALQEAEHRLLTLLKTSPERNQTL